MSQRHDHWGSRLGFILATSGAAIGLGNIQRFPYVTAQWGGAAFVLVYLACVLLLGLPLILAEFALGRHSRKNPKHGMEAMKPGSLWWLAGLLTILTSFFILSYYLVVSGWTLAYSFQMLAFESLIPIEEFAAKTEWVIPASLIFLCISVLIVQKGLQKGVEKCSKIFMPLLFILLLLLTIRSLSLEGAKAGVLFYLSPDFSKISWQAVLFALSQAFFSLCIGEAVLVTYGSYAGAKDNLLASAGYIALFDTLVAFLSGLMIFPAVFAFNKSPEQGVGLIFNIMPDIFMEMPGGTVFGFAFFLILGFAALTTCIALLEIPTQYMIAARGWSRRKSAWLVGLAAFVLSIPSALSKGASVFFSTISIPSLKIQGFYEVMDFVWGSLGMIIGGFFICIFVGWAWGAKHAAQELSRGSNLFPKVAKAWVLHMKYVLPALLLAILLGLFFG